MFNLDEIERELFQEVANIDGVPEGAYNFRVNGKAVSRKSSPNINISPREGGIKVEVAAGTANEVVHIPVVISKSGFAETVYNDFYIGDNAVVTIVAGCGIYNCGADDSIHDGVHSFYVGSGAKVRYIEKHYGDGPGAGKILNPQTKFFVGEGSEVEVLMEQIKGVDSARRETNAELNAGARISIVEKTFTHGRQELTSEISVLLAGADSSADVVSRAVARDVSKQVFHSRITGAAASRGHTECDAILMDSAKVLAVPSLDAQVLDAELVHEAAIGKIAGEELLKLMTLGLTRAEAESRIVNGFLR